ncbi:spermidine/putrescine ABC transporter substrate-binding protein [Catenovulum sp. SM1970]|uniref:polyamine ABC transporter substrate-binding protein n=1 Tax=Marinifaba aquimaris TaxID=2741323 RepID=UPI00157220AE|nr:spermidine/putrescine ABC transporter substrate-binding protein [Marinifaba aquimaris]NTS76084.1 spermidine/putrescine ABC transporter substrate-binding protein [Marinifaba aquimaris]
MQFTLFLKLVLFIILVQSSSVFAQANKRITLLTWPEYLPESVVTDFEKLSGIQVKQHYFETDETKEALLNSTAGKQFDIVLTSLFRLENYASRGWLETVSQKQAANLQYLDTRWAKIAQQTQHQCVPYLWGSVVIIYRKDLVSTPPTSWREFFLPNPNPNIKTKLLKDSRDLLGSALLSLGRSVNDNDPEHIKQAGNLLYRQLPSVSSYGALELSANSELISGDVALAMSYNGDAIFLKNLDNRLEYVVPDEGSLLWLDCLAVMKSSVNKQAVFEFINYINQPKVAAIISEQLFYATPNKAAKAFIKPEILHNTSIYLPDETVAQSEFNQQLPTEALKMFQTVYSQILYQLDIRSRD